MLRLSAKRFAGSGALAACLLLMSSPAKSASDDRNSSGCETSYNDAHSRVMAGQLIEGQQLLRQCARSECGFMMSRECAEKYVQLDQDIPSIVTLVTDSSGKPRVDFELRIDGTVIESPAQGTAIPLNPGVHEISFAVDGKEFHKQKLLCVQGQRNRVVSVTIRESEHDTNAKLDQSTEESAGPKAATADAKEDDDAKSTKQETNESAFHTSDSSELTKDSSNSSGIRTAVKIGLGGVALAGIAGYGLLTYWGRKDNDALAQCSPYCAPATVDHIHKTYLAADVSLGVGLAALVAEVWALAAWRSETPSSSLAGFNLGLHPTRSGAVATAGRSF